MNGALNRFVIIIFVMTVFSANFLFPQSDDENLIQMAILLDTSNSMDGLIDQAKSQLWKIVNELSKARKNGKSPRLEVALFEYGNDRLSQDEGYIRLVLPLTTDLDRVSEELFNLKTSGGYEYCGQVIEEASARLGWSANNGILKMIFIAGNEEFTQGGFSYKKSCKDAVSKGIIVNTVFCGNYDEGVSGFWKDGADLADGKYLNINQNQEAVYIKAPQDEKILKLNAELNDTYVAYGTNGEEKKKLQEKQDTNASSMNQEAEIQRAVTKSSSQYQNDSWDLVDAVKEKKININELDEKQLPENLRKMSPEDRKKYIDAMLKKREDIQKQIAQLNKERDLYIAKEKQNKSDDNTLDAAIIKTVREQAKKKNFVF